MYSLGLSYDSYGGIYDVFGQKAVFLGANLNGLEKAGISGSYCVLFGRKIHPLGEQRAFLIPNVIECGESWYFWAKKDIDDGEKWEMVGKNVL